MIEVIDNSLQLAVTTGCAIWATILALRNKSQRYFIIACFYVTFALGLLFWLLYLIVMTYTPKIFYVSDLSWIASFLFLLLFNLSIVEPGESRYRPFAAWVVVVILLSLTGLLCMWGDYLITLFWCGLTITCGYFSTRGFLYARKQTGEGRKLQYMHIGILIVVFLEFALWITSGFFKNTTLANPYFWCDFALTIGLLFLFLVMKKVVKP